jgi:ABC-type transport system involved in multi-copper enzyme maturation permease subunit
MRPPRGLPTIVWKEIRALLPVWGVAVGLAAAVGVSMMLRPDDPSRSGWWLLSYLVLWLAPYVFLLTPVALGALAMGHDFSHRTWSMMLSQPMARGRLLAVRMAVLAAMIATASLCSGLALRYANERAWDRYSTMAADDRVLQPGVFRCGGLLVAPGS